MDLIFATHNKGKLNEVQKLVPEWIKVISLEELALHEDIEETGTTLQENALIKARSLFERYRKPVMADDTGLEVKLLNGAPGVYSARYAGAHGDSEKNMDLLLKNLSGIEDRTACFRTVIAYIDEQAHEHLFEGTVQGVILTERTGDKGFGYDPIFKPEGKSLSFAQMPLEEKNAISHRGRALKQLSDYLNSL